MHGAEGDQWETCSRLDDQGEVLPVARSALGGYTDRLVTSGAARSVHSVHADCPVQLQQGELLSVDLRNHLQSISPPSSQLLIVDSHLQARYAHSELIKDRKAVGISKGTYLRVHYKNTR